MITDKSIINIFILIMSLVNNIRTNNKSIARTVNINKTLISYTVARLYLTINIAIPDYVTSGIYPGCKSVYHNFNGIIAIKDRLTRHMYSKFRFLENNLFPLKKDYIYYICNI